MMNTFHLLPSLPSEVQPGSKEVTSTNVKAFIEFEMSSGMLLKALAVLAKQI